MDYKIWFTAYVIETAEQWQRTNKLILTGDRQTVEQCTEYVLMSCKNLVEFFKSLLHVLPSGYDYKGTMLDATVRNQILHNGLQSLTDDQLVKLIINPMTLLTLSSDIERTMPLYWAEILERKNEPVFGKKRKHFCL